MYKAIIFDLDGTAIPNKPEGMPSEVVVDAVNNSKLKLSAATGRAYRNSQQILHALGLVEPCVVSAGTQIVNPKDGSVLWQVDMTQEDVAKVLRICSPFEHEIIWKDRIMGEGKPASQLRPEPNINVLYVMECDRNDADTILRELSKLHSITAVALPSWAGQGVDIHVTSRVATKEHAVEELLRMLNVSKQEVVGVGDGANDIHLFKSVGRRVAMGNASENLKFQADEVCDTVDNDGLAKVINKYAV